MTRIQQGVVLFRMLGAFAVSACAENGALKAVSVEALDDTTTLQQNQTLTALQTRVLVRNSGSRPVYLGPCGPDAQKQIGSHWVTVWTPVCGGGAWSTLGARDSVVIPVQISAFTQRNGYPQLDPRFVPGVFRLVFRVAEAPSPTQSHRAGFRFSTSFVVKGTSP